MNKGRIVVFLLINIYMVFVLSKLVVTPEKPEILYYNKKYINSINLTIGKRSRHSPSYINLDVDLVEAAGDNFTLGFKMFELLSGRWQPLGVSFEFKLCYFINEEPVLGAVFKSQLPKNYSCPFQKGLNLLDDMVVSLDNFKFNLPFTFSSAIVKTRADFEAFFNSNHNDVIGKARVYITFETKTDKKRKAINSKPETHIWN